MEKDILGLLEDDAEADLRFNDFLLWEQASRDTVDFKKIYVDIAGDLIAGLLLSQIVYWFLPNKEGKTKIRVIKRGRPCIAKARHDWWDEVRISPKQYDRAVGILRKLGILRTKNHRFNGVPIPHLFLQQKQLLQLINKELTAPKENPTFPKGQSPFTPKVKVINRDYGKDYFREYNKR
ncbi:MAG TPA: hypothetical protein ENH82_11880 [bacterium]|nr:hypothetical protein [bacterium]